MAVTLLGSPGQSWLDGNGDPLASGKVYAYEEGTTTAKDTYPTRDDADNSTNANANPVILDSAGRAQIWLDGRYKIVLKDSADATIATYDEVGDSSDTSTMARGHLAGLDVTLDTDTDHDVNVTAGEARDGADTEDMTLATEITKQMDSDGTFAWAVGDDAGGLDTGSPAADTTYYIWLIKRTDTGVVDVLISASVSSPTLPTNYDKKRLIGQGYTDASSNWVVVGDANRAQTKNNDGVVQANLQPAFLAFNSVSDTNQTGNGTAATVDFDTEVYDQNGDFATDTFTAPIGGRYLLSASVELSNFAAGADAAQIQIVTSNRSYSFKRNDPPTSDLRIGFSVSVVADMDASDTATVAATVSGMAGDTVTIFGAASPITFFSGVLLA